jgi:hypothetical protein
MDCKILRVLVLDGSEEDPNEDLHIGEIDDVAEENQSV